MQAGGMRREAKEEREHGEGLAEEGQGGGITQGKDVGPSLPVSRKYA